MQKESQCYSCKHYIRGLSCTAYGFENIPIEVFNNEVIHDKHYKVDAFITYEPIEGQDEDDSADIDDMYDFLMSDEPEPISKSDSMSSHEKE